MEGLFLVACVVLGVVWLLSSMRREWDDSPVNLPGDVDKDRQVPSS